MSVSETISTHDSAPLAQGDILRRSNSGQQSGPTYAFVLSADCDIRQNKIEGMVSILPIYSFKDYICKFWAQCQLISIRESLLTSFQNITGISRAERQELAEWISQEEISEECLLAAAGTPCKKVKQASEIANRLIKAHRKLDPLTVIAALSALETNPVNHLSRQLDGATKSIGESGYLINEIATCAELGFVIRLPRIESIKFDECFTCESTFLGGGAPDSGAYRIARFTDTFKSKIMQTFCHQIGRIGLDDVFKEMNVIVIEELAESLCGEPQ